jgi:hypothetical protein
MGVKTLVYKLCLYTVAFALWAKLFGQSPLGLALTSFACSNFMAFSLAPLVAKQLPNSFVSKA